MVLALFLGGPWASGCFALPLRLVTIAPITEGRAFLIAALLVSSFTWGVGCTCGESERATPSASMDQQREAWLEACIPSPQRFWDDIRSLAGSELREAHLPETLDQLAMWLSGLPAEQVRGSIDWQAPLLFVVYEPPEGRPGREAFALRSRRADSSPLQVQLGTGPRILEPRDGQRLFVDVDGRTLFLSPSEWALSALRAHPDDRCGPDRRSIEVRVTKALIGSRQIASWVEQKGAWLEASAREATARRGRPTLGDPEVLARMLARWGEGTRARAESSAPLRVTLSASPDMLEATVEGRRRHRTDSRDRPSQSLLRAIAPDAYFAFASEATVEERGRLAHDVVDILAQIAGDRMPPEERHVLESSFSKLASAVDGQVVVALRPSLEPGLLVGLAALESSDPDTAVDALTEATQCFEQGSLQNVLEHLGAHVEVGEPQREAEEEAIAFLVTTPADVSEERGQITRRLMGETPRLAWRRQDRTLLVAFGPEPRPELSRMAEVVTGTAAASIMTQPVLARAAERRPRPQLLCYGWLPAIAGLVTHGGPGAGGLAPGGFALAVGDLDDEANSWQASVLLDSEQLRSLIRWFTGGSGR